ncbi:hypothetical protein L3Q82_014731 [Scortum barcoo]|uniref:Uncharacterized protein n=1 Tax=Scortum barcoo TaxID=214431 RepID=A0ACB8VSV3_9TELE|nr:hypothetical protein L3Q82_014731 [Scortum barcoo]
MAGVIGPLINQTINGFTFEQWIMLADGNINSITLRQLSDMCNELQEEICFKIIQTAASDMQIKMYRQTREEGINKTRNPRSTLQGRRNYLRLTTEDIEASLGDCFNWCFGKALRVQQKVTKDSEALMELFLVNVKKRTNRRLCALGRSFASELEDCDEWNAFFGPIERETASESDTTEMVNCIRSILMDLVIKPSVTPDSDVNLDSDSSEDVSPDLEPDKEECDEDLDTDAALKTDPSPEELDLEPDEEESDEDLDTEAALETDPSPEELDLEADIEKCDSEASSIIIPSPEEKERHLKPDDEEFDLESELIINLSSEQAEKYKLTDIVEFNPDDAEEINPIPAGQEPYEVTDVMEFDPDDDEEIDHFLEQQEPFKVDDIAKFYPDDEEHIDASPKQQDPNLPGCHLPQQDETFLAVFLKNFLEHVAYTTTTSAFNKNFNGMLERLRKRTEKEKISSVAQNIEYLHILIFNKLCQIFGSPRLLQAAMLSRLEEFEDALTRTLIAQLRKTPKKPSFLTKLRRFFCRKTCKVVPASEMKTSASHSQVTKEQSRQKTSTIRRLFSSTLRILRKPYNFGVVL